MAHGEHPNRIERRTPDLYDRSRIRHVLLGSAVSAHLAGISNHVVGVILMIVGVLALGIGLVQSFAAGSASRPAKPTVRATRSTGRSQPMPPA